MKRTKLRRLTKAGKSKQSELINPLYRERAINLLSDYEETGLTPKQVFALSETVYNLQERIKKLEEWQ